MSIDDVLMTDDVFKPTSTRAKLVIEFNTGKGEFQMTERDKEILNDYIDIAELNKTTNAIETNIKLRPFERKAPYCRKKSMSLLTLIVLLVYFYINFIILQLALFNLVMLGVMIVYFRRLYLYLHSIEVSFNQKYKNKDFKKFIETENTRYYHSQNIELIGGEKGKWLELQLPDSEEERNIRDKMTFSAPSYKTREVIEEEMSERLSSHDDLDDVPRSP